MFMLSKTCTILLSGVDNGGDCMIGGKGYMGNFSTFPSIFLWSENCFIEIKSLRRKIRVWGKKNLSKEVKDLYSKLQNIDESRHK